MKKKFVIYDPANDLYWWSDIDGDGWTTGLLSAFQFATRSRAEYVLTNHQFDRFQYLEIRKIYVRP